MKVMQKNRFSDFPLKIKRIALKLAVFLTFLSLILVTIILFTYRWIETVTSNTHEIVLKVWSIVDTQIYYERLADPDNVQFKCLASNQVKIVLGAIFSALGACASFFILLIEGTFNKIFRAVASIMSIFACVTFTSCLVCFDSNLFDTESFLLIRSWLYWLLLPIILLQILSSVLYISCIQSSSGNQKSLTDNSKKLRLQISSDPFHYLNSTTVSNSKSFNLNSNPSSPAQLNLNTKNELEKSTSLQIDKKRSKSMLRKKLHTIQQAKYEILKRIKCEKSPAKPIDKISIINETV